MSARSRGPSGDATALMPMGRRQCNAMTCWPGSEAAA